MEKRMSHLTHPDCFIQRHIGPRAEDQQAMLDALGYASINALIDDVVPHSIRLQRSLDLDPPSNENEILAHLKHLGQQNQCFQSLIGMGYYGCYTPTVILRNILENPGWYTQYTPYQAEIAQGRLEALVNFQTVVSDLTGMPLSNSSLLDEGTAAAEAMGMCWSLGRQKGKVFLIDEATHPQTIAVIQTRAEPLGLEVKVQKRIDMTFEEEGLFGVLFSYPDTYGDIDNGLKGLIDQAHAHKAKVVVASDLLALTLLTPPGELGADIVVGSSQRFGVPFGAGGPHAGFLATQNANKRLTPGRIIGLSKDRLGHKAYRLALQTREQHIRRDKATSNICTAQVLLAVMAGMYAVYHGPTGLKAIAHRTKRLTDGLVERLRHAGFTITDTARFDTFVIQTENPSDLLDRAWQAKINLRPLKQGVGISLDETMGLPEIAHLYTALTQQECPADFQAHLEAERGEFTGDLKRTSSYLTHPTFHLYQSEHELLRYMHRLQAKDLSLTHSMIPLGSCTMKLNATTEMIPVTWPEFAQIHPFVPSWQRQGYQTLFNTLEKWLAEITGFNAVSLQPNAGSQGEYASLLVIRAYHQSRGEGHRKICLIPTSAHGTNPASAVMAGFKVVAVKCDDRGDIDLEDLASKTERYQDDLAALMITYPSTHGVFEEGVARACTLVHNAGGQVYMDGANMNAQMGVCRPGDIGADVCHLNLHKTFCIPHGGGGPGMGPIGVASHLAPFLPGHPLDENVGGEQKIGPISAGPYGSPSILPISYAYIAMMGAEGLKQSTEVAILNANYMAHRLKDAYSVLFTGSKGLVAHEFILDCRDFKGQANVSIDDIAKRLMDYGFHAPTMSWPVAGTLMVEPTESESKEELDRFCDAMLSIRKEIQAIQDGELDWDDHPLANAPHTVEEVCADEWNHTYSRNQAAYPVPWIRQRKFWPAVARVDNAFGDRNLVCTCPPMDEYEE
jgi:glycine dehydrogenase